MAEPSSAPRSAGPVAALAIHRALHGGASYDLTAPVPGVTSIGVRDPDGDVAVIAVERAAVRQLIEDLELVAGLRPTAAQVDLATALIGTTRVLFERLEQLVRTDPARADQVVATITAHIRAWRPMALLPAEVVP